MLVSLTVVVSGRESSPARVASPFAVGVRDVPWPSPSPHVLQLLVCCSRRAGAQGPVPPDASTKCVSSGRQVKPYLTLLFPSTQGWTKRCLPSAGLPSLLLLPLAITAEGPQGHEMSAIDQVRPSPLVGDGDTGGQVYVCSSCGQEAGWGASECPLVGCGITGDDLLPPEQIYPQGTHPNSGSSNSFHVFKDNVHSLKFHNREQWLLS